MALITYDEWRGHQDLDESTFIFWDGKYKGKVGSGGWMDQYILNARKGYGELCLIDANNVAEAKTLLSSCSPTTFKNVSVQGDGAIQAVARFGGKVL
jgi:hypothetical protein